MKLKSASQIKSKQAIMIDYFAFAMKYLLRKQKINSFGILKENLISFRKKTSEIDHEKEKEMGTGIKPKRHSSSPKL